MGMWLSATRTSGEDLMAYFAEIDATNTVLTVLVVSDDDASRGNEFLADDLGLGGTWIETTKGTRGGVHHGSDGEPDGGTALRYNTASIGCTYDITSDAFYPPSPYPSWSLDENFLWQPPSACPTGTAIIEHEGEELEYVPHYDWDEATTSWVEITE